MASLTEFTVFGRLPIELRLKIWGLVPHPARIVGLVPPSTAWYDRFLRTLPQTLPSPGSRHDDSDFCLTYHFRFVVQPRDQVVFPPLHVNREARAVWLRRLFQPPRQRQAYDFGSADDSHCQYVIQFDMPFFSYETDIFTVFEAWKPSAFVGSADYPPVPNDSSRDHIDPFLGLDRTRIQHVAFCEIPYHAEQAILALDVHRLPALRALSLLTLGPDVFHQHLSQSNDKFDSASSSWLEMPAVDVQNLQCELYDMALHIVESNPFLNEARPWHAIALSPNIRPLPQYTAFVKAWLWHSRMTSWNANNNLPAIAEVWWDFVDYLFKGSEDTHCPLPLEGCGFYGHGREEMLQWEPGFEIDYKLLCAREWVGMLGELGVFDTTSENPGPSEAGPVGLAGDGVAFTPSAV